MFVIERFYFIIFLSFWALAVMKSVSLVIGNYLLVLLAIRYSSLMSIILVIAVIDKCWENIWFYSSQKEFFILTVVIYL